MERYVNPSESVSTRVKRAIAELEESRSSDLGTLTKAVDPDETDTLVNSPPPGGEERTRSIAFNTVGIPSKPRAIERSRLESKQLYVAVHSVTAH